MRRAPWLVLACAAVSCGLDAIPAAPPDAVAPDGSLPEASADGSVDGADGAAVDGTLPLEGDDGPSPDAGGDASAPSCIAPAGATTLYEGAVVGDAVQLFGLTADGYAIYAVPTGGGQGLFSLYAATVDPGDAAPAATLIASDYSSAPGAVVATTASSAVMIWDRDPAAPVGTSCTTGLNCRFRVWTPKWGLTTAPGPAACWGATSADGENVMYVGDLNSNATLGSLLSGRAADLTSVQTLETSVALGVGQSPCGTIGTPSLNRTCAPNFGFVGPGATPRAVAAYCQPLAPNAAIVSFSTPFPPASPPVVLVPSGVPGWSTDATGVHLFTISAGEPVLVDTIDGGSTRLQTSGGFTAGRVSPDGRVVYFIGPSGPACGGLDSGVTALWKETFGGGIEGPLACGGVDVLAVGGDGRVAFFDTRVGSGGGSDLYAVSTARDASVLLPLESRTGSAVLGFTTDLSRLTWLSTSGAPPASGPASGLLTTFALDGGAPEAILAHATPFVAMADRARLAALVDPYVGALPSLPLDWRGDIYVVDTNGPPVNPKPTVRGAYYRFSVDTDPVGASHLVFACNAADRVPGLYAVPIP